MHPLRRSCQLAVRHGHAHLHPLARPQCRAFSRSTAGLRGALPVFVEPSTPALASLLATFNAKVLLPLHLNKEQQQLVYAQENRAKLDAEPVEITLGDVTLPLEHIDRNHLPDRFQSIRDIVRQSETREDWANVVRLLEGFENAGFRARPKWQEMIVRHLYTAGMHHLVLKALQRVKATGLRLTHHGVLLQVLRGIHDQAALADWAHEETTKALRMATQVTELMEAYDHHRGRTRGEADHRRDPVVIALPTELAAVLARRHGGDVAQVKKLANRLVTALKQSDYSTRLDSMAERFSHTPGESPGPSQMMTAFSHGNDVLQLIIIWHALRTSQTVLGANMPMADEAKTFETEVEQLLANGIEALTNMDKRIPLDKNNQILIYAQDAVERCR